MKTMKIFCLTFIMFLFFGQAFAQFTPKNIIWDKSFGEKKTEQAILSGIETADSSFIFTGYLTFKGKQETAIWRIDKHGNLLNKKILTEGVPNFGRSVIALKDGGYVVIGSLMKKVGVDMVYDVMLIKTNDNLEIESKEQFGGASNDIPNAALALEDGGFIVVGGTNSQGNGKFDMLVMKFKADFALEWEKTYGEKRDETAKNIVATDEGFTISGYTESKGEGGKDFWILKTDMSGNILQQKTFGKRSDDEPNSLTKTIDGGYLVGGYSMMGYVENRGNMGRQLYFLKLDKNLKVQWGNRRPLLGSVDNDEIVSVVNTSDNGYTIAAYTNDSRKGHGNIDLWLLRFGEFGNQEWETMFGLKKDDKMLCLLPTSDGKYLAAGFTKSKGISKKDMWILKLADDIPLEEDQFLTYEQMLKTKKEQGIIGLSNKKHVSFNYKTAFIDYYPLVEKEVNSKLDEMMKRGVYETKDVYVQRIKLSNSIKEEAKITQEALKKYAEKQIKFVGTVKIMEKYNTDNETFKLKITGTENIVIHVPIAGGQAQSFENNWNSYRFADVRYGIYNKKFVIANANIIVAGKIYTFDARKTTEYGKDMQLTINSYDEKQLRIATIYSDVIKSVKDSMEIWEQKEEFETQQQFASRTIQSNRKIVEENFTQSILREYASSHLRLDGLKLGKYDSEMQNFPVEIPESEPIYISVSINDTIEDKFKAARVFKENWDNYQFSNVKYGIYDYRYVILSADITVSDSLTISYNALTDTDYGKQIQKAIYLNEVDYGLLDQYTYLSLFPDGEQKVVPPKLLLTDINFKDFDGNQQIDANEDATVCFTIINDGKGKAYRLNLKIFEMNGINGLKFQRSLPLGDLESGEKLDTAFTINANIELEQGKANFKIRLTEANRNNPDDVELRLVTNKFVEPKVELTNYEFTNETGGKTQFDQKVYLKLQVANIGKGTAKNVKVKFINPDNNILAAKKEFNIGSIRKNETKIVTYEFIVSKAYSRKDIPFQVIITEQFGKYGDMKTIKTNMQEGLTPFTPYEIISDVDVEIPKVDTIYKNRFALIFGNEDYTRFQQTLGSESDVEFAAADAIVFERYVRNVFCVPKENIKFKVNARRHEMNKMIEELVQLASTAPGGNSEIIVFYAGHGFPDEISKEPYIMPVDISGANVTNGISLTSLYDKFTSAANVTKTTVFIDACFSGGGREQGLLAARAVKIKPKETELQKGKLVVFSASSGDQTALPYSEKNHGMFTYALLKKLKETEGDITYGFLDDFVVRFVENKSRRVNKKEQNPKTNVSAGAVEQWKEWKIR